jgi:LacI family asc operon transcriptional repressor
MTTMLEVAKRAGVSKATVSRVLSGNGYVSQETKDRVFQAIEESGYRPNLLARNLATKRTQTLGLVVTNTLYHGVYFQRVTVPCRPDDRREGATADPGGR